MTSSPKRINTIKLVRSEDFSPHQSEDSHSERSNLLVRSEDFSPHQSEDSHSERSNLLDGIEFTGNYMIIDNNATAYYTIEILRMLNFNKKPARAGFVI